MFAKHPDVAQKYAAETPDDSALPERVGAPMKPPMKRNPQADALSELHAMLSQHIGKNLKAKKDRPVNVNVDPEDADDPETELMQDEAGRPARRAKLKA